MSKEYVILVDKNDSEIGVCEKLEAHQKGLLHRAFSIFLINDKGELLLQQRAASKYHTPNLWTNTCCSHPRPDENMETALARKLFQEMGIKSPVSKAFSLMYSADFDNGLTENELDHVYIGTYNDAPKPNPEEVKDWKYSSFANIKAAIAENEDDFTPWFKLLVDKVMTHYNSVTAS